MTITNTAELIAHGNPVEYVFFWGHQRKGSAAGNNGISKSCFSQWYDASFVVDAQHFLTAEHYMMYHKAKIFGDQQASAAVLAANNPHDAKAIGRTVKGFDAKVWDAHSMDIVIAGNLAKFSQNPDLRAFLLSTAETVLVEASPVDRIWGIGLAEDNPAASDPNQWRGRNLLGFALMAVRTRLQAA